jgi:hypothetical protein
VSVIEQAAKVIFERRNRVIGDGGEDIAQALADAGLLLTDEDRAVLATADVLTVAHETGGAMWVRQQHLYAAVRARREAAS